MTMDEATRRQYLALLGIEQWIPRDAVDEVVGEPEAAAPAVPAARSVVPVETAADVVPVAAPSPGLPADRAAQISALLAQNAPPRREPRPAPDTAAPATPAAPTPATAPPAGERFACSLLPLLDGLLLVATFDPGAPGLSGPEHTMLAGIAGALVPGVSLPATIDFTWPPAGLRLPGMDRPGAGRDALAGLLAEQRKRGARDVVVLGEALAALIEEPVTRLGLTRVGVPSLAAMVADPGQKRVCWEAVRHLRRQPPA